MCNSCKNGVDAVRQWEYNRMMIDGYYVHIVGDDIESPTGFNCHSHGFEESWGHKDIQIVVYLNPSVISNIFSRLADLIRSGAQFVVGKEYNSIIDNYNVRFIDAVESDRDILRLILPDSSGNLYEMGGQFAQQLEP